MTTTLPELTTALFSGEITSEEMDTLRSQLRGDDSTVDEFVWECLLADGLQQVLSDRTALDPAALVEQAVESADLAALPRVERWLAPAWDLIKQPLSLAMIVSSLVITTILLSLELWTLPEHQPAAVAGRPTFVAKIVAISFATFDAASDGNLKNRDLFDDDQIVLNSGLAVIEYDTGARVVLEGPATYHIAGANGGDLRLGKLVARVDTAAAHGFAVAVPGARVVDLGTEFGVEVAADGQSDVAVLTGEVELIGANNGAGSKQRLRLSANEAAMVTAGSGLIAKQSEANPAWMGKMVVLQSTLETGTKASTYTAQTGEGRLAAHAAPPEVVGAGIANLPSRPGGEIKLWNDIPVVGQTFSIGDTPLILNAVTVHCATDVPPTKEYVLRVGHVSGDNFVVVAQRSAQQYDSIRANDYLTFSLDPPVTLLANGRYGFDVGMVASSTEWRDGLPYLFRSADSDYDGGSAYRSGDNGEGNSTISFIHHDLIFHLDLSALEVPADDAASE